jgi:hypothetical protein
MYRAFGAREAEALRIFVVSAHIYVEGQGNYQGGYGILKDYLTPLRPVAKAEPAIRFETDPGR